MIDANIWIPLVCILYIIPMFWLLDGFDTLVETEGSRWMAVAWVLAWPVFMIVDMMGVDRD